MLRGVAARVAWLGRTVSTVLGLAVVLALVFGAASAAFGANGGNFILGALNNTATAITRLAGNVDGGPALQVVNPNPGANDTALSLNVQPGEPPMRVSSDAKVTSLNADRVDGMDSTALGVTVKSAHSLTGGCTSPAVYSACAPVTVKVPVGRQYHVTVFSSFSAESAYDTDVLYCPAIQGGTFGLSCISTGSTANASSDTISLAPGYAESAASSGEIGPLPAGTYTFSTTLLTFRALLGPDYKAHTTVMVSDASAPGPPIQ